MPLGQAVADADGAELEGEPALLQNPALYGVRDLSQRQAARDDLVPTVDDGDKGAFHLSLRHAQGVQQSPLPGPVDAAHQFVAVEGAFGTVDPFHFLFSPASDGIYDYDLMRRIILRIGDYHPGAGLRVI